MPLPWKKRNDEFIVIVVPASAIRQMIMIDFIGSSALFVLIKKTMYSDPAAFVGSWIFPPLVKYIMKRIELHHLQTAKRRRLITAPSLTP
ncbi:hypothetical protein MH117_18135 [Paenibacillus sp. ACRRX]|uniref:hypothetical protein n=1 Tax=unclassified Paenibacillus TaxID=185978 RepID=UPI001EF6388E|nr:MULTISPECIES: hypothetical protein [unclassified Paenibacillus]MCG7409340.1 hypothetical protein [Paenibacillus sp. ACRRX]MDK8179998.1 hypothetical protein [Paenibacillus sp. UMB4589-SE434]